MRMKKYPHSESVRKNRTCQVCNKVFTKPSDLQRHLLIHSGARPFECKYCNKKFRQKSAMVLHAIIHTGEKPYKCEMCSMAFNQGGNLNRHVRRAHFRNRRMKYTPPK